VSWFGYRKKEDVLTKTMMHLGKRRGEDISKVVGRIVSVLERLSGRRWVAQGKLFSQDRTDHSCKVRLGLKVLESSAEKCSYKEEGAHQRTSTKRRERVEGSLLGWTTVGRTGGKEKKKQW
jgi:hypothetical protein